MEKGIKQFKECVEDQPLRKFRKYFSKKDTITTNADNSVKEWLTQ